ncbi:gamma-glutamyltranspeptidase / glutathione hydrolase / leukotriene-C4 hydrolase [Enteropsectra breve]|nr:gamma-glutamyltranspeptidase / glutathione hydrolase / leukotriene-C4 hydrolase [Enteropsectra breve]
MAMKIVQAMLTTAIYCSVVSKKPSTHLVPFYSYAVNTEVAVCSQLGQHIIENQGNAMDAAVAVAICISIINSFSSGIGGGGFLMVTKIVNKQAEVEMLDFRETAPAALSHKDLQETSGEAKVGGLSIATPGELMGLYVAHKKHGKLPWKRLFKENIHIATQGFPASEILVAKLNKNRESILQDHGLRQVYAKDGEIVQVGDKIVRDNFAKTLATVADDPLSFYNGTLADSIITAVSRKGGVLAKDDLKNYRAIERNVVKNTFLDRDIYSTSLPTAGALVIEALKILELFDLHELKKDFENGKQYEFFHIIIEILKLISADRNYMGDPDVMSNPKKLIEKLLEPENIEYAFKKIDRSTVLDDSEYRITSALKKDHGTTHFNIIDSDGMIVQMTSTVNLEFGAKYMDPVTGIIFNNQIDDFFIPNIESAYRLEPMNINILKRGKRPYSSAAPILIYGNDEILAIGATGGSKIISSLVLTIGYLAMGLSIEEAISWFRLHHQLVPNMVEIEQRVPVELRRMLVSAGHRIKIENSISIFTSVQALHIFDSANRREIYAVSDMRKNGISAGR